MANWTLQQAQETYNIRYWSGGYFDINREGHLQARPRSISHESAVDLYELTQNLQDSGLSLPVLVRFVDILHHRVETLCEAFRSAMEEDNYHGGHTAVYPIKVNQQRTVVDEILSSEGRVGLEAGSKPELMAVLALSGERSNIIICNGYKDREYIRLALIGQALGHQVYIVVEKLSELEHVIREASDLGITPLLGIRVRLASLGAGKWQNTGGEKSKFGLSPPQILLMLARLQAAELLPSLQLMHFHMGSQIPNIRDIQRGMREACRIFAEMHQRGVSIRCVDVGGGLGIDYEGTRTRSYCSINYNIHEYAKNIVHALWEVCEEQHIEHPHIITESGRAMTAHHAVLVTNVIDVERPPDHLSLSAPAADDPIILQDFWQQLNTVSDRSALEVYHDAAYWVAEARDMHIHGVLSLEQRALAEQYFFAVCRKVRSMLQVSTRSHRDVIDDLNNVLADKYFCNFSVFQSIPDIWAIQQIFPIVPLHKLDQRPTRRATLQDLTCDSDGRIDAYVDRDGVDSTLPVHAIERDETYLFGIFLVGAYQEILGDMHNLFGDTDSVNAELTADGGYRLAKAEQGDTVQDVLRYVHFEPESLLQAYERKISRSKLATELQTSYLEELSAGLRGYTYLED